MPRSFKLLQTLGEGAFGAVHLAEVGGDEGFVQRLAVKWLHPQWSHDAELAGRLRDEARLLALLDHEHIVRVHGLTRLGGRLAILMEPVDGVDLSRLGPQQVPPRAAAEIVESVADALEAAWKTIPPGGDEPLRVVHRDIKPSNVMVTSRGGVKVMDFGVARARFDSREAQTRSQQYGTARYMAPERWLDGVADAPSDIFSLGITLIELVGGHPVERPRLARDGFDADMTTALAALDEWPAVKGLAARMTAYTAADRPDAAEVAALCRSLAPELPGSTLRDWAPGYTKGSPKRPRQGALDGTIVQEDASAETFGGPIPLTATAPIPERGAARPDAARASLLAPVPPEEPTRTRVARNVGWAAASLAVALIIVSAMGSLRTPAEVAVPTPPPPEAVPLVTELAPPEIEAPVEAPAVVEDEPEKKVERRKPRPEVEEVAVAPVEAPAVVLTVIKFRFDEAYTVVAPGGRVARNQGGLEFPVNQVVELTIRGGNLAAPATCTVKADPSKPLVVVDPTRSPICSQGQGR